MSCTSIDDAIGKHASRENPLGCVGARIKYFTLLYFFCLFVLLKLVSPFMARKVGIRVSTDSLMEVFTFMMSF